MIKAVDLATELSKLTPLVGRSRETTDSEAAAAFSSVAPFGNGAVFIGSFSGESKWERHSAGDELVQVLDGEAVLTILHEDTRTELTLGKGMLTVVPRAHWHRFNAPKGVTVLTLTPQPTDHSKADDPRQAI
ncbi:cupin domain-containing protein [Sneathiella chinensis]|uniref:Cupin type-2 domain-containing protein n=1 Tax=Sneathiella chinensis TaxID=349750 RepID=A0ABQ5U284_9PROT|nr:cupin domain-containing protein [Sneathiella chinensis]GLQ06274.1 hypothetical protein GCM10007924_14950 [Sneathiella chinensis]